MVGSEVVRNQAGVVPLHNSAGPLPGDSQAVAVTSKADSQAEASPAHNLVVRHLAALVVTSPVHSQAVLVVMEATYSQAGRCQEGTPEALLRSSLVLHSEVVL